VCFPHLVAARGLHGKRFVAVACSWAQALLLTAAGDVYHWQLSGNSLLAEPADLRLGQAHGVRLLEDPLQPQSPRTLLPQPPSRQASSSSGFVGSSVSNSGGRGGWASTNSAASASSGGGWPTGTGGGALSTLSTLNTASLGLPAPPSVPVPTSGVHHLTLHGVDPALDPVVAVFAGAFHSVVATAGGALLAWGRNAEGALGRGDLLQEGRRPEVVQVQVRVKETYGPPPPQPQLPVLPPPPAVGGIGSSAVGEDAAAATCNTTNGDTDTKACDGIALDMFPAADAARIDAVDAAPAAAAFGGLARSASSTVSPVAAAAVETVAVVRVGRPWRRILDFSCGKDLPLVLEAPCRSTSLVLQGCQIRSTYQR